MLDQKLVLMNGFELLRRLGLEHQLINDPEIWASLTSEQAFMRLLSLPLKTIIRTGALNRIMDNSNGVVKGCILMEILSYRDVGKPLPMQKSLETSGEEPVPQYSATRTFKLLLTDGSDKTYVAMEYESCKQLDSIRIGGKLLFHDIYFFKGVLLITPKTMKYLGCNQESNFDLIS